MTTEELQALDSEITYSDARKLAEAIDQMESDYLTVADSMDVELREENLSVGFDKEDSTFHILYDEDGVKRNLATFDRDGGTDIENTHDIGLKIRDINMARENSKTATEMETEIKDSPEPDDYVPDGEETVDDITHALDEEADSREPEDAEPVPPTKGNDFVNYNEGLKKQEQSKAKIDKLYEQYAKELNDARKKGFPKDFEKDLLKTASQIVEEEKYYNMLRDRNKLLKNKALEHIEREPDTLGKKFDNLMRRAILSGRDTLNRMRESVHDENIITSKYNIESSTKLYRRNIAMRNADILVKHKLETMALKVKLQQKQKLVDKAKKPTFGERIAGLFGNVEQRNHLNDKQKEKLALIDADIKKIMSDLDEHSKEYRGNMETLKSLDEKLLGTKEKSFLDRELEKAEKQVEREDRRFSKDDKTISGLNKTNEKLSKDYDNLER